jgi:hypothetical protein
MWNLLEQRNCFVLKNNTFLISKYSKVLDLVYKIFIKDLEI